MLANLYLDYAATAPLLPEARTAMIDALNQGLANASSLHTPGHLAHETMEAARAEIARLINADPAEIIFTSGGSEANNLVAETFRDQVMAYSATEHPSVIEAIKHRTDHSIRLPVDTAGQVILSPLVTSTARPALVSIMLANNETGVINDIVACKRLLSDLPASTGSPIYLHADATQALGKIPIDVKSIGVDYLTISAHKIGGPVGIGALYVKTGAPLKPLIFGGGQESHRRAGTSNVVAMVGFAAAAQFAREHQTWQLYDQTARPLRNQLALRILSAVPHAQLNSPLALSSDGTLVPVRTAPADSDVPAAPVVCLPHLLNVSFAAAEGESIQLYLDAAGISVSTGSACAAGDLKASHVLRAIFHDSERAHGSIRFSLGLDTCPADIDRVMSVLPGIVQKLQSISTIKIEEQI